MFLMFDIGSFEQVRNQITTLIRNQQFYFTQMGN